MPSTRRPWLRASIVADAMTPLIPGAGPPPTRIASVSSAFIIAPLHRRGRRCGLHARAQLGVERVEEPVGCQPGLIGSDQGRQILGHAAGLDHVDAHLLERLGKLRDLRRAVYLTAMRETARPSEDRRDRV